MQGAIEDFVFIRVVQHHNIDTLKQIFHLTTIPLCIRLYRKSLFSIRPRGSADRTIPSPR